MHAGGQFITPRACARGEVISCVVVVIVIVVDTKIAKFGDLGILASCKSNSSFEFSK